MKKLSLFAAVVALTSAPAFADDFAKLDQALPTAVDAATIAPVFDFDSDGCYPSAAISRTGAKNGGLNNSGALNGDCASSTFLNTSNTYHRYACLTSGSSTYCGHMYVLYFLKDQVVSGVDAFGHRHDLEFVTIYTQDGVVTDAAHGEHSSVETATASELETDSNGHIKIVYHKESGNSHVFRWAKTDEDAENPYGYFVTPTIVSWYEMTGDNVSNATLRNDLNTYDYGDANFATNDSHFLSNLNAGLPSGYPTFTQASVEASQ